MATSESVRTCIIGLIDYCEDLRRHIKSFGITDTYVIDSIIKETLEEYSEYDFLYAYKRITTRESQTVLDIYTDISPHLKEILIFRKYVESNSLIDSIYDYVISDIELEKIKKNIAYNYEIIINNYVVYFLKYWKTVNIEKIIYEDRFIKVYPNTTYEILYTRVYTCGDWILSKKMKNLLKLVEYNLMIHNVKQQLMSKTLGNILNSNIRSVSISGMNVSFYNTPPERLIREIENEKKRFLMEISEEDYMLPERF